MARTKRDTRVSPMQQALNSLHSTPIKTPRTFVHVVNRAPLDINPKDRRTAKPEPIKITDPEMAHVLQSLDSRRSY